jgi:hypothetical protein
VNLTLTRLACCVVSTPASPTPRQLTLGRVAAAIVGAEALAITGFAVFYLLELLQGQGSDPVVVVMSIVTMLVFVVGLGYVAYGLWTRHPRAQAPAIAANGLLVPLGIAMFQFAPPLVAAVVLVGAVTTIVATIGMGRLDD